MHHHAADASVLGKRFAIVVRAIRNLDHVVAVAHSYQWELLGWHHRVFRVRATTTAVHDAARASAFQSGLARRAIVGPVRV